MRADRIGLGIVEYCELSTLLLSSQYRYESQFEAVKMATMSISLPDELKQFAEKRAESGDFSTPSDYVRSLIRADKEQAWTHLEALLITGLNSGEPVLDSDESREALRARARQLMAEHKGAAKQ